MRKEIYKDTLTDGLKEKIVNLKILSDSKSSFEEETLEKISGVHPQQLRRVCTTNYKYICIARCGNVLTYWANVSLKEFKWHATFSNIREAVIATKRKFAEYNIIVGSIKRF